MKIIIGQKDWANISVYKDTKLIHLNQGGKHTLVIEREYVPQIIKTLVPESPFSIWYSKQLGIHEVTLERAFEIYNEIKKA